MSIIQTQSKSVAQFASGLFGYALGAPTNTAVLAEAGLTGLNSIFNTYYTQTFSALSAESVARLLVSNVGVVAGQNGITTTIVNEAVSYVKNQLTAAAATGTQGQTVASLLIGFSNMAADPVFGAAARAWNTQIDKDMAYTESGALLDVPVALAIVPTVAAPTYTITADHTSVTEGGSVVYTVTTTGVEPGTSLAFLVSGTGNALASTQAGVVTINAEGKGTIAVPTFDNAVADDAGVLSFKLISGSQTLVTATDVTVATNNDTVVTPPIVTAEVLSVVGAKQFVGGAVTEGDVVTFTVSTQGYAAGTVLPYTVTGTANAAASATSGFLTIGADGKATVAVGTAANTGFDDAGQLTMTVSAGLNTAVSGHVNVLDDDTNTNTYTLTVNSDRFTDSNDGDDTFVATVGGLHPTLTSGDKLNGGAGYDTLEIRLTGDDAIFPTLDTNTDAFKNIEQVVIDKSNDNRLDMSGGSAGIFYDDGDDTAVDASYFDTDGSLEKLTIRSMENDVSGIYDDVFLHKNMTLRYEGAGDAYEAQELDDADIYFDYGVTETTIELSGVGGYWYDSDDEGEGTALYFSQGEDTATPLESLTITGTLAQEADGIASSGGTDLDNGFWAIGRVQSKITLETYDDDSGSYDLQQVRPDTITISLDATDDVERVYVDYDQSGGGNNILANVETLDFSGSTVGIQTWINGDALEASEVTIKMGSGNDVVELYTDVNRTAVTIDLGTTTSDHDTVILNNWDDGPWSQGNIHIDYDSGGGNEVYRDIDLTEDLITINNFDVSKDKLYMPILMHLSDTANDSGGSGEDGYHWVGIDQGTGLDDYHNPFVLVLDNDIQAAADAGAAQADRDHDAFYLAVEGVANELMTLVDEGSSGGWDNTDHYEYLEQHYAAAFEYEGSMYLYVDSNRTWDEDGGDTFDNRGLSDGDILIKLTGVTSVHDVVFDTSVAWIPG